MSEDFGSPVTPVEAPKKNNNVLITVIVVLVVLCCCCAVVGGWGAWTFGDYFMEFLGLY
jgi:hypothetical protein